MKPIHQSRWFNPQLPERLKTFLVKRECQCSKCFQHTFTLCESGSNQRSTSMLIQAPVLLPAPHCVICQKTIEEVGGRRIVAQQVRGVCLSDKYRGGGDPNFPYKSFQISPYPMYLTVWGELSLWTEGAVERAMSAFQQGKRPWFCQICGNRVCPDCGSPQKHPVGSDVLYDDGCSTHIGMLPIHPGCINPECPTKQKEKE